MQERCIHELPIDQCADCAPPPPGVPRLVLVTPAGQVYHSTRDCAGLLDGQARARTFGHEAATVHTMPWSEAAAMGLAPCSICLRAAYGSRPPAHHVPPRQPAFDRAIEPQSSRSYLCSICRSRINPGQRARVAGRAQDGTPVFAHHDCA